MSITEFSPEPGYIYVPVEPAHLDAVRALVRELRDEGVTTSQGFPGASGDDELRNALWTDAMLGILIGGERLALEIVAEVMDVLAQSEEPLNVKQLAEATGRERSQMQTVWTHFSRHLSAKYGHKSWPVETRSGNRFNPPRGNDEVYYWVSPRMADRWRKLRGL